MGNRRRALGCIMGVEMVLGQEFSSHQFCMGNRHRALGCIVGVVMVPQFEQESS